MRYRTARDSVGLYTLLPSLVCGLLSPIWFCVLMVGRNGWQRRFLASSYMDCHIARPRRTRYPFPNHQTARPHTMRQICQTHSRRPCSPTSPILPQVCSSQPAVAISTRHYKHVRIVRPRTVVGFVPSRCPVAASFHKTNSNSGNGNNNNNNKPLYPHSHRSHRALRRGTPHWATRRNIQRCCRASRRATPRTARVLSFLAFAVQMPRCRRRNRVMVLDLSIVPMEMLEMGVCPALRRTSGGTYIAMGTE